MGYGNSWRRAMVRLCIICEGDSDRIFIDRIITPYLESHSNDLQVYTIKIGKTSKHSGGGNVSYYELIKIINQCQHDRADLITTFIDFYGTRFDTFPCFKEFKKINDNNVQQKIRLLEADIKNISSNIYQHKIIPYVLLHEYEMIYFADLDRFIASNPDYATIKSDMLIVNTNYAPEEINNSLQTAPSKRINAMMEQSLGCKYKKTTVAKDYCNYYPVNNKEGWEQELSWIKKCPNLQKWLTELLAKIRFTKNSIIQ
jgi:hypothetical protein